MMRHHFISQADTAERKKRSYSGISTPKALSHDCHSLHPLPSYFCNSSGCWWLGSPELEYIPQWISFPAVGARVWFSQCSCPLGWQFSLRKRTSRQITLIKNKSKNAVKSVLTFCKHYSDVISCPILHRHDGGC